MTQDPSLPWWRLLNRYHWFVLTVAVLGWMFDCLDQQLFTLARVPAMKALLHGQNIEEYAGYTTSFFLIGWALGGLTFGVLGDRIGRAKTLMLTILIYSICTGLSSLSKGFWDFTFYRFITGVGVGGEFAVGVSLVAEAMPDRARPHALGLLQALSTVGNIAAALIGIGLGNLEKAQVIASSWRWMFLVGAIPALLVVFIQRNLKEPERWKAAKAAGQIHTTFFGPYIELFSQRRWRRNAIVGLLLACAGIIGLWGIVFFVPDLVGSILTKTFVAQGQPAAKIPGMVAHDKGVTMMFLNFGGFLGMMAFTRITARIGRRAAFAIGFVIAMASTVWVFLTLRDASGIYWTVPIMGFCIFSIFGGYAIYFPELFPTHLRSTGVSFCYNVGRFVAAIGPAALGLLTKHLYKDQAEPLRYAGVTMCAIFLLGLAVLPFAPETEGEPLPEGERGVAH